MHNPLDGPPDPIRQKAAISDAILKFMSSTAVMCGENFLTHEEHQAIIDIAEGAATRWLDAQNALEDLDFEP